MDMTLSHLCRRYTVTEIECMQCGMRDVTRSVDSVRISRWLRCSTGPGGGCGGIMRTIPNPDAAGRVKRYDNVEEFLEGLDE